MNLNLVIESNCKPRASRGFALVVALSLMAFMLVLTVTLLSLMDVETRSADNNMELQKAREGARLALSMAISQLQEYAGEDARVTARAEILGVDSENNNRFNDKARFWTSVWRADGSSTGWPKWLVSWHTPNTEPDPSSLPVDSVLMLLAGAGSGIADASHYVYAPKIDVFDKDGRVISRIAWWTGDEGVKASVGQLPLIYRTGDPNNPLDSLKPNLTPDNSTNALQTMLATTHGLEELFSGYDQFNAAANADARRLDRITDIDQLNSLSDFSGNWLSGSESAFHTITPMSLGILASTTGGGLMQDLSLFPRLIDDEFEAVINESFQAAAANASVADPVAKLRRSVSLRGIDDLGGVVPNVGDIARPVAPVLTNLVIAFELFEKPSELNSRLRIYFFCELWNPYTNGLLMSDGVNNLDLELEITGLQPIQIQSNGTSGSTATVDLNSIQGNPLTIRLEYDSTEAWLPGMTKNWVGITAGPSPYRSDQTTEAKEDWTVANYAPLEIDTGVAKVSAPSETFNLTSASNPITVKLYSTGYSAGANKRLLSQVEEIEYGGVSKTGIPHNEPELSLFGFQFMLKGPNNSNGDSIYRGRWLFENDPRNPSNKNLYVPTSGGITGINAPPINLHDFNSPATSITAPQRLFDRSNDRGTGDFHMVWQDAPLFELPRERILSLASLQHLYFHGERPFKVGNSWGGGGATNTLGWFDRYYFSGFHQSETLTGMNFQLQNGLPNPVLIPYGFSDNNNAMTVINGWINNSLNGTGNDTNARVPAQNLLVSNRFNLNSTSVEAWKAVLGGLRINGWMHVQETPDDRSDATFATSAVSTSPGTGTDDTRKSMFSRFSQSLQETYYAPPSPEDFNTIAPTQYYRRGARYLEPDQLTALAQEIVTLLKEKGSPFISMEQFLQDASGSGSLLEQSIAAALAPGGRQQWDHSWETTGIVGDPSDRIDIDYFSPGFLTQADIMTAIGPMLAPRSDTFRIRARCQTLSPFDPDEVIGDATIEALVQRVPDPFDSSDNINASINRKFKIMSVRWLTTDEL